MKIAEFARLSAARVTATARTTETTAGSEADNPSLNARRTWNDHVARLVAARTMWQAVGLLSLLVTLGCMAGLLHLSARSQFIPYVVEVDKTGNVQAVARADQMAPANRAVIEAQLEKFITLSRRVTTDIALQRSAIFGVFAMLTPDAPATSKMTEHLSGAPDQTPFERAKRETVSTEIKSVLQQSAETWQVQWTETTYDRSGSRKAQASMQALVHVYQGDPRFVTEQALRENPLGIYVRDFSWNRVQPREVPQ